MHKTNFTKIVILVVCFLAAAVCVQSKPDGNIAAKKMPLRDALANIPGWNLVGISPVDDRIVQELKLDDYVSQYYSDGDHHIDLYIGYYFSTKKVGAAHDPMVCMPGQGWEVVNRNNGKFVIDSGEFDPIEYSTMTVRKGNQIRLVFYWFQSFTSTSPDTLRQKMSSFWYRLTRRSEDNAFVRLSTGMTGESDLNSQVSTIKSFVARMYPSFMEYVVNQDHQ